MACFFQGGGEWWRGRGRVSPLLTSQLASPASSPMPSDISSPPPTSPPSPPAPTSPSVSPYHTPRRHHLYHHHIHHHRHLHHQATSSKGGGAEFKDLLKKINQLPGIPTPPPSPAVSNAHASFGNPTIVHPKETSRSPSPPTTASTPTPGAKDFTESERKRGNGKILRRKISLGEDFEHIH